MCFIKESNDVPTLSINELQSSLLVQEQWVKAHKGGNEEQSLSISNSIKSYSRDEGRVGTREYGRGEKKRFYGMVQVSECGTLQ